MTTAIQTDWRYSDERMEIREQVLKVLLSKFGHQLENGVPKYSSQSIYECAHDWVSQGNVNSDDVIECYLEYYANV